MRKLYLLLFTAAPNRWFVATERAGTPDTDPRKRSFSDEEMAAITTSPNPQGSAWLRMHTEMKAQPLPFAAGLRSIEHGTYWSDDTLAEMKKRGT
jgi:hypothetical protein